MSKGGIVYFKAKVGFGRWGTLEVEGTVGIDERLSPWGLIEKIKDEARRLARSSQEVEILSMQQISK